MKNKKILIVCYGGGHVNMLIPVIKALKETPNIELVVLGLTTAGSVLNRHHIPFLGFRDLVHLSNRRSQDYGRFFVEKISSNNLVPYDESVAYMGLNFNELVEKYGEQKAYEAYEAFGRSVFYPINLMKNFLNDIQPDLVLATNSPRSEKAAIDAAVQLNIPSICLVDLFVFQSVQWIGKSGYATKLCVLSEYVKKQLTDIGRKDSQIVVTGNPVFDQILEFSNNVSSYVSGRRWNNAKKVILWASQPEPERHPFDSNKRGDPKLPRKIESQLFQILDKNPGWQLIIRPHPSENTQYSNLPENVEISSKSESLYELLASVDSVITMTSTVAIEAALMGKPVITIDLSIFTEDSPYSKMGLSQGVHNLAQLEDAIQKNNVIVPASTQSIVGKLGNSTNNVVKVTLDLLG